MALQKRKLGKGQVTGPGVARIAADLAIFERVPNAPIVSIATGAKDGYIFDFLSGQQVRAADGLDPALEYEFLTMRK